MHAQPFSSVQASWSWIWLTVWRHDMDTLYTHHWLLVRRIDRLPVDFHHKVPVMHTLYCPFVPALVAPSSLYKPNSRWTVKWALYLTLMWRNPNECRPFKGLCTLIVHCCISWCSDTGPFYEYSAWLFSRRCNNNTIATVSVNQPWAICVTES